jgi:hypothetical protein
LKEAFARGIDRTSGSMVSFVGFTEMTS